MILDRLENAEKYKKDFPEIYRVLAYAKNLTEEDFSHEREYLQGNDVFINFAEYNTKPRSEGKFEAHRKYIDVMCMISGKEAILVKNTDSLSQILSKYDSENDYLLAEQDRDHSVILLQEGDFCILFPQDAHAPALSFEESVAVKKAIGKVIVP